MSLIRWSPFSDPFNEFDSLLPTVRSHQVMGFIPELDVYQTESDVVVEASLPGIDPKNVQINIENNVLTVSGEQEAKTEVEEKNYYRREISHGSFHRSVVLPSSVDSPKAKATYQDGLLKIEVPIQEQAKPKQVKVEIINKNK